jgi:hypothetical protein
VNLWKRFRDDRRDARRIVAQLAAGDQAARPPAEADEGLVALPEQDRSASMPLLAMTRRRTAARIVGGALLAAWLAAAASVPSPQVPAVPAPARRAAGRDFTAIEIRTQDLRARLESKSTLHRSSRNPFRFAARRPAVPVHVPALSTASPATGGAPPLALVGIAEQESAGGVVRTAVISGPGGLFLVREGEPVAERYRVNRVGADAVELGDAATGGTIRLGLR